MANKYLRVFREVGGQISIQKDERSLTCTVNEFVRIESAYPALPAGMAWREWTPERQCLSDGETQREDDVDCSSYINKIAAYHHRLTAQRWVRKPSPDVLDSAYYSTRFQEAALL